MLFSVHSLFYMLRRVELKVILITAANTWGLFLLVLLLGYGLVEVPRGVWYAADIDRSMALTYFRLAKLSTEKQEAVEDLDDVLEVRLSCKNLYIITN